MVVAAHQREHAAISCTARIEILPAGQEMTTHSADDMKGDGPRSAPADVARHNSSFARNPGLSLVAVQFAFRLFYCSSYFFSSWGLFIPRHAAQFDMTARVIIGPELIAQSSRTRALSPRDLSCWE